MTRTSRRFGIAAITLAVMLGAAGIYANAQNTSGRDPAAGRHAGPGPGGPGGHGGPMDRDGRFGIPLRHLDLTDAQREQIRGLMQSHDAELKTLRDREFAAREALHATIATDATDEGAIRARSGDVAAVHADMAVTRARIRAEVFQFLTPEQRAKVNEVARHPGRGRGPGPRP